ncbi:MAG: 50S ribosomal protein L13 [Bacillota bacterium]
MTTFFAKPGQVDRKWYVIDATGKPLGRLATEVATLLRGKHKPIFTPFVDTGDHVIVVNADKVKLTGKKLQQKQYVRHSGYPGGLKTMSYQTLMQRNPEKAVYLAVQGMIPHNSLGRQVLKKLRVYRGATHPHLSQLPLAWPLEA